VAGIEECQPTGTLFTFTADTADSVLVGSPGGGGDGSYPGNAYAFDLRKIILP
jgi:hypothetical protein